MNITETIEDIVTRMTDEAIQQRIPCIVFIGCLSVIGVIGNIHVIILFSRTDRKPSTYIVFVKTLAFVDLTTCFLHMPMEIFDLTRPYTFYSEVGCKLFRFNNALLVMSSTSILVLIAFERYRRVCNPLKRQMTVTLSKWLCLLVILISLIITLPMYFINGHHIVRLEENGVNATGYMCFINDKYRGTVLLYSYLGFMTLVFILSSAFLIVAYLSISRVVFSRHDSLKVCRKYNKNIPNDITTISGSDFEQEVSQNHTRGSFVDLYKNVSVKTRRNLQKTTLKTTRPLIVITGIFITVFAPYLILSCVISLNSNFKGNLSNLELTFYQIGIRLLLINNVCNPFVYGFTDERFKQRIKSFYCKNKS